MIDYIVPNFSGMAALSLIRRKRPGLVVIFVSGKVGDEVAIETMRSGARDFISKDNLTRLVPVLERELPASREIGEMTQARPEEDPMHPATSTETGPGWHRYIGPVLGVGLVVLATFFAFFQTRAALQNSRADGFRRDVALRVHFIQHDIEDNGNIIRLLASRPIPPRTVPNKRAATGSLSSQTVGRATHRGEHLQPPLLEPGILVRSLGLQAISVPAAC